MFTLDEPPWSEDWGDNKNDWAEDIAVDSQGDLIIVGNTENDDKNSSTDIMVLKVNSEGKELWEQTWGNTRDTYGFAVTVDNDNDIYIAGSFKKENETRFAALLLKFSSNGEILYYKTWYYGNDDVIAKDIALNSKKEILIVGEVWGEDTHFLVFKGFL